MSHSPTNVPKPQEQTTSRLSSTEEASIPPLVSPKLYDPDKDPRVQLLSKVREELNEQLDFISSRKTGARRNLNSANNDLNGVSGWNVKGLLSRLSGSSEAARNNVNLSKQLLKDYQELETKVGDANQESKRLQTIAISKEKQGRDLNRRAEILLENGKKSEGKVLAEKADRCLSEADLAFRGSLASLMVLTQIDARQHIQWQGEVTARLKESDKRLDGLEETSKGSRWVINKAVEGLTYGVVRRIMGKALE